MPAKPNDPAWLVGFAEFQSITSEELDRPLSAWARENNVDLSTARCWRSARNLPSKDSCELLCDSISVL